ncbi:MAG: hypothetical protein AB1725_03235 [Armatimonadota bacterium]
MVDVLRNIPDNPALDGISEEITSSLFHAQGSSRSPWVNEEIVFAWLDGGRLLIVDEGGAASLGTVGGQVWKNGWFDLAMLHELRDRTGGGALPSVLGSMWLRIENNTRSVLRVYEDLGKAVTPEEGGRALATVPPGGTVERPVLRVRAPWLIVESGPRLRVDAAHSGQSEVTLDGIRFSVREAQFEADGGHRRWGLAVRVDGVAQGRVRMLVLGTLIAFVCWIAWRWLRLRGQHRS